VYVDIPLPGQLRRVLNGKGGFSGKFGPQPDNQPGPVSHIDNLGYQVGFRVGFPRPGTLLRRREGGEKGEEEQGQRQQFVA
jgi:hypothetical protein